MLTAVLYLTSNNEIYKLCQLFDLSQLITEYTRVAIDTCITIDIILSYVGDMHKHTYVSHATYMIS